MVQIGTKIGLYIFLVKFCEHALQGKGRLELIMSFRLETVELGLVISKCALVTRKVERVGASLKNYLVEDLLLGGGNERLPLSVARSNGGKALFHLPLLRTPDELGLGR